MRMRIRVNSLVYVLIGTALVAGLLVTAFARPEPALTASDACYGRCASATTLSLSRTKVTLGHANVVVFRFKVRGLARGTGTPTGLVMVRWNNVMLCRATIAHGSGHCSPAPASLPLGKHTIVASYVGNGKFGPSVSKGHALTVVWPRPRH